MPAETTQPPSIHQAMRYSVFAGGKRIRPILCMETARIFDANVASAHYPACAIEFIHTYSLIHDDLPALDNDDLRRGKPTSHKKFGEAAAILAGDALLTLAFETIAATPVDASRASPCSPKSPLPPEPSTAWSAAKSPTSKPKASESTPKCSNTFIDRKPPPSSARPSRPAPYAPGHAPEDVARLRGFGESLGLLFQVTDDILDVEETSAALGKTAGKDAAQQKATYPAVHGLARSHQIANELAATATAALAPYGERASRLREIAEYLVQRRA